MRTITPPDAEALLPLDTLRVHCRIDGGADDPLLEIWRRGAMAYVEHYTGHSIGAQVREVALPTWPAAAELPGVPVTAIQSVHYLDPAGAEQVLPATAYRLDLYSIPQRWVAAAGAELPALLADPHAVRISYSCGAVEPPAVALQVILLLVDHADKNRGAVGSGSLSTELPLGVTAMLDTLTDYTGRGG